MKQIIIFAAFLFFDFHSSAQLIITPGATWTNTGAVFVTLENIDLINNGILNPGNSTMWFSGNSNNTIEGDTPTSFYDMYISKSGVNKISLFSNIFIASRITFSTGLLDLNQKYITLEPAAYLNNENQNSRIIGPAGGEVIITVNMNAPNNMDAGSLGAIITDAGNLGNVTIKRGHKTQTGAGLLSSTNRYFDIQPTNNAGLSSTLRFNYFDAELNGHNENTMIMYKSVDNGVNWTSQSINSRDAVFNFIEKTGITSFSKWTLANPFAGALPVTGLQFFAKRINSDKVQLDWSTIQEINNRGFYIERKKDNETDFSSTGFVNSSGLNGNSSFPLSYSRIDNNNFSGKTYYRLKQEDIDGKYSYSLVRIVTGSDSKQTVMQIWPVPASGPVNVVASGLPKDDMLMVFDMSGRLVQQQMIKENTQLQIKNLLPGTYLIRLAGQKDMQQKIIIQ